MQFRFCCCPDYISSAVVLFQQYGKRNELPSLQPVCRALCALQLQLADMRIRKGSFQAFVPRQLRDEVGEGGAYYQQVGRAGVRVESRPCRTCAIVVGEKHQQGWCTRDPLSGTTKRAGWRAGVHGFKVSWSSSRGPGCAVKRHNIAFLNSKIFFQPLVI